MECLLEAFAVLTGAAGARVDAVEVLSKEILILLISPASDRSRVGRPSRNCQWHAIFTSLHLRSRSTNFFRSRARPREQEAIEDAEDLAAILVEMHQNTLLGVRLRQTIWPWGCLNNSFASIFLWRRPRDRAHQNKHFRYQIDNLLTAACLPIAVVNTLTGALASNR